MFLSRSDLHVHLPSEEFRVIIILWPATLSLTPTEVTLEVAVKPQLEPSITVTTLSMYLPVVTTDRNQGRLSLVPVIPLQATVLLLATTAPINGVFRPPDSL